ncbi:MAG: hypothetical protein AB1652_05760 [Bacillota bacterium]
MDGYKMGEISTCAYLVVRGKPLALVDVPKKWLDEAINIATNRYGLKVHIEDFDEGTAFLFMYKYPHILEVIKAVYKKPETVFAHWVWGKLFGYEEAAIADYIAKKTG